MMTCDAIGDACAVCLERVPQRQQHLAAHVGQALLGIADPEPQHDVQRGVAEVGEPADRPPVGLDPADGDRGLYRQFADLMRIGIVGDAEV